MGERRGTKGLELWCRRMTEGYPGVEINNMTTSWRDGLGFCAIIHHFRPDLIDFSKLNKEDVYHNNDLAFQIAERHLGIPALLEPEDMVEYPVPDRLSILTYLSQYYQRFVVAQDTPTRIISKRSSNVPDGSVSSPSTSPSSPKISRPSGGIGRRDPCAKCQLPVFIAERLTVGKYLYHRSCFRCARCNSQLNLVNYYETETENQFCCEVCPDEERQDVVHSEKKSVLLRSLCDEEKSSGLQQMNDGEVTTFIVVDKDNLLKTVEQSSEYTMARSSFINSQLSNESEKLEKNLDLPESALPILLESESAELLLERSKESVVTVDKVKDLNISSVSTNISSESYDSSDTNVLLSKEVNTSDKISGNAKINQIHIAKPPKLRNSIKEKDLQVIRTSLVKSRMYLFENKDTSENFTSVTKLQSITDSSDYDSSSLDSSIKNIENYINEDVKPEPYTNLPRDVKALADGYPEDLNPFGVEYEATATETVFDQHPMPAVRKKVVKKNSQVSPNSYNPFDSDEDDTDNYYMILDSKVTATPRINLNPFLSEEDESENEEFERKVQRPVPLPRNSRSLISTPEPKPRKSSLLIAKKSFGSDTSVDSGITNRKKKPAPKPPLIDPQQSFCDSFMISPAVKKDDFAKSIPKVRKVKKAPLPPTIALMPSQTNTNLIVRSELPTHSCTFNKSLDGSNLEEEKVIKNELNKNRKDQIVISHSSAGEEVILNKSTYGKWKRRKGPAPCRPLPQKRRINSLPIAEIKRELDIIEIQQQGLEKQGVKLEQIIRDKCEGPNFNSETVLPLEVEELILQLFELVNEKNDLFRKQAELMYLRRQQRLEEEHADLEYQIRCLMLEPEPNKTDTDKTKEEELINRLLEVVERRNEIVECLEMDRIRESEEDDSIHNQLTLYTLKRNDLLLKVNDTQQKRKHKKEKKFKFRMHKKADADKDVDESEVPVNLTSSDKEKKKKFHVFS